MEQKQKLLNHIQSEEQREAIQKIVDKALRASAKQQPIYTEFFDPGIVRLAEPILQQIPDIKITADGGYQQAERARFILLPLWFNQEDGYEQVTVLEVVAKNAEHLTHRDYLGSLLGLGIKREKIGDILVHKNGCQIIVDNTISDYIIIHLTKVGNKPVQLAKISAVDIKVPEEKTHPITVTVASLRLDAILAMGFNLSREKAAMFIKGEKVKLNYLITTNLTNQIKRDDLISCRGKGRLKVIDILGETRKGRIKVKFLKFS